MTKCSSRMTIGWLFAGLRKYHASRTVGRSAATMTARGRMGDVLTLAMLGARNLRQGSHELVVGIASRSGNGHALRIRDDPCRCRLVHFDGGRAIRNRLSPCGDRGSTDEHSYSNARDVTAQPPVCRPYLVPVH